MLVPAENKFVFMFNIAVIIVTINKKLVFNIDVIIVIINNKLCE